MVPFLPPLIPWQSVSARLWFAPRWQACPPSPVTSTSSLRTWSNPTASTSFRSPSARSIGPLHGVLSFFDVDRHVIDLNWKVVHGVLYTAQRLASFGLSVPLACFCGPTIESLDHLFYYCPLAQSVLSWLQSLLFSFSFMCPALLVRHVRFSFSSDELCVTPRVFVYLLNLCKFYIWQSQNDFRFRNIPPGAVDVIAKVRARLKCHLPIFFKRFQSSRRRHYFHRQWGARGVVASVSGNVLSIVL